MSLPSPNKHPAPGSETDLHEFFADTHRTRLQLKGAEKKQKPDIAILIITIIIVSRGCDGGVATICKNQRPAGTQNLGRRLLQLSLSRGCAPGHLEHLGHQGILG